MWTSIYFVTDLDRVFTLTHAAAAECAFIINRRAAVCSALSADKRNEGVDDPGYHHSKPC